MQTKIIIKKVSAVQKWMDELMHACMDFIMVAPHSWHCNFLPTLLEMQRGSGNWFALEDFMSNMDYRF